MAAASSVLCTYFFILLPAVAADSGSGAPIGCEMCADCEPDTTFNCFSRFADHLSGNVMLICHVSAAELYLIETPIHFTVRYEDGLKKCLVESQLEHKCSLPNTVLYGSVEVCPMLTEQQYKCCQKLSVHEIIKPEAPLGLNVTFQEKEDSYLVRFSDPPSSQTYLKDRLIYELVYRPGDSNWTMSSNVKEVRHVPFILLRKEFQPGTKYELRVRSKPNGKYFKGSWSEWSSASDFQTAQRRLEETQQSWGLHDGITPGSDIITLHWEHAPGSLFSCLFPLPAESVVTGKGGWGTTTLTEAATVPDDQIILMTTSVVGFLVLTILISLILVFWKNRIKPVVWPAIPNHEKTLDKLCNTLVKNSEISFFHPESLGYAHIHKVDSIQAKSEHFQQLLLPWAGDVPETVGSGLDVKNNLSHINHGWLKLSLAYEGMWPAEKLNQHLGRSSHINSDAFTNANLYSKSGAGGPHGCSDGLRTYSSALLDPNILPALGSCQADPPHQVYANGEVRASNKEEAYVSMASFFESKGNSGN